MYNSKYKYPKTNNNFILPFGKYRFCTIKEVLEFDWQYLYWAWREKIIKPSWITRKKLTKLHCDNTHIIWLFDNDSMDDFMDDLTDEIMDNHW